MNDGAKPEETGVLRCTKGSLPMQNALLVGLSRQMSLSHELDVIANNIANLDTTGFKADNAAFSQYIMPGARDDDFAAGKDRRISFVQDRATWVDFSPGTMQRTGNPLDVAIDGKGYFTVQTQRGQRYTRNGALQVNAAGTLVTSAGDPVLGVGGPIQLQNTDSNISIGEDGTITVREGASATSDSTRGKLQIVTFANTDQLQKEGSSLFSAPTGVNPGPASTNTRVVQGAIEQSNVSAVAEMARMIDITRTYTQISSILQQAANERTSALDKLSAVPA
jgi:flagellar basal-body rod protein FlgF